MAHYFETENVLGEPVEYRFVKRIMKDKDLGEDIWFIRFDTIPQDGKGVSDTRFIPLDTDEGMALLARYAVPLDCLKEEN